MALAKGSGVYKGRKESPLNRKKNVPKGRAEGTSVMPPPGGRTIPGAYAQTHPEFGPANSAYHHRVRLPKKYRPLKDTLRLPYKDLRLPYKEYHTNS